MADHAIDDGENDIFVYTGGQVPQHLKNIITHARIDESITEIDDRAFQNCPNLQSVDFHPGIEKIGKAAFKKCSRLRSIKLAGVKTIGIQAFAHSGLRDVEFGKELRSIAAYAFYRCKYIQSLDISFVKEVGKGAFEDCVGLTYAALGDKLERIKGSAFAGCTRLRFITLPIKDGLLIKDYAFNCTDLERVDLVGSVHKIVSSLHVESWRVEMNAEIHHINKVLPTSYSLMKTLVIRQWIQSVTRRFRYFKVQHSAILKEAMTLLELALWKAKLDEKVDFIINDNSLETKLLQLSIIESDDTKRECRITCGADIVIKNVLPFLTLPSETS